MERRESDLSQRIKFLTDTTCDLPAAIRDKLDIGTLPLHVFLGEQDHLDGVDVTMDDLFAYADQYKQLPKTAAAGVVEFAAAFTDAFQQGYDAVIYTGISSALSSTLQNARLAREEMAARGVDPSRIYLVDSLQLSTGISQLLLRGQYLAAKGMEAAKVVEEMERLLPRINTSFVVDTLHYLHMGGRCSTVAYAASSMLRIHPQIRVVNGGMVVGDKYRGSLAHCLALYQKKVVADALDTIEPDLLFITHTCTEEMAKQAEAEIRALGYFKNILVTRAGATISSHCGPNTLGYLFLNKP